MRYLTRAAAVVIAGMLVNACSESEPDIHVLEIPQSQWPPGLETSISLIEAQIKLPEGAAAIAAYNRYYAQKDGIVSGVYVGTTAAQGRVYVVAPDNLPMIFDGGCGVVDVSFNPALPDAMTVHCNGEA